MSVKYIKSNGCNWLMNDIESSNDKEVLFVIVVIVC